MTYVSNLQCLRDTILMRADLVHHAVRAGFCQRGRAWLCAFHKDRSPSASLHRGRIHCFACGRSWNVIDLEMQSRGCDFVAALRTLADEYRIPWPGRELSSAERSELAIERERDAGDLDSAQYWRAALLRQNEHLLSKFTGTLFFSFENKDEPRIHALTKSHIFLRDVSRTELLRTFRAARVAAPESVESLVSQGRDDDRHAREVTIAIIRLLEAASLSERSAA